MKAATTSELGERGRALVCARVGDPFLKEGRARLIWAANTAEALAKASYAVDLWGTTGYSWKPWEWLRLQRREALGAEYCRFYGVEGNWRAVESHLPIYLRSKGMPYLEGGTFQVKRQLSDGFLRRYDLIHTRDWRVAERAVRLGISTIFEDHHESFNEEQRAYPARVVEAAAFRLGVGISVPVGAGMVERGMPREKLMIEDSGVNRNSLVAHSPEAVSAHRKTLLGKSGARFLVGYAGGLHAIRGIELLFAVAAARPEVKVLAAGGRGRQAKEWNGRAKAAGLNNLQFIGYLAQRELPLFLQSMDVLALPYGCAETAPITSPLKFFEYMAAGRPVAACRIPALARFEAEGGLGVTWAPIGEAAAFEAAVTAALARDPLTADERAAHRAVAEAQTWEVREERILRFAGMAHGGRGA